MLSKSSIYIYKFNGTLKFGILLEKSATQLTVTVFRFVDLFTFVFTWRFVYLPKKHKNTIFMWTIKTTEKRSKQTNIHTKNRKWLPKWIFIIGRSNRLLWIHWLSLTTQNLNETIQQKQKKNIFFKRKRRLLFRMRSYERYTWQYILSLS